jgi:chitodextrinase
VVTSSDTSAPTAPGGLTVTAHTSSTVALSWTASTDNVAVTGYRIRQLSGSTGTQVGTTAGTTSFTVSGLLPSTAYTFDVQAVDAAGNVSPSSNQVSATTDAGSTTTNLAAGKAASESSHTQGYAAGNATDGNASTYWESANSAFPQWLQVDLGAATAVKRLVVKLPPSTAWGTRTQTISVQAGTANPPATQLAAAGYTFNPATGNTATITLPATVTARYVRLTFTANTGWPAGQVSELEVYSA